MEYNQTPIRRSFAYHIKKYKKFIDAYHNKLCQDFDNKTVATIPVPKVFNNISTFSLSSESLSREAHRSKCKSLISSYIDKVIMGIIENGTLAIAIHKIIHDQFIWYTEKLAKEFNSINHPSLTAITEAEVLLNVTHFYGDIIASSIIDVLEDFNITTMMIDKNITNAGIENEKGEIIMSDKNTAQKVVNDIVKKTINNSLSIKAHTFIPIKSSIGSFLAFILNTDSDGSDAYLELSKGFLSELDDVAISMTRKVIKIVHTTINEAIDKNEICYVHSDPLIAFLDKLISQDEVSDFLCNTKI